MPLIYKYVSDYQCLIFKNKKVIGTLFNDGRRWDYWEPDPAPLHVQLTQDDMQEISDKIKELNK